MDTDEEESSLSTGIPKSSGPRYEGQGPRPTYEAQAGPLDGVPRSSNKPRGPRPNFGQKGAKVVTLPPSPALARPPGKYPNQQRKSVTLRKTLLTCIIYLGLYLANEFYEVL